MTVRETKSEPRFQARTHVKGGVPARGASFTPPLLQPSLMDGYCAPSRCVCGLE